MRKSLVDGKICEVVTYEEYGAHQELYANNGTAVEFEYGGKVFNLPHRSTAYSEDRPGVYTEGCISRFVIPDEDEEDAYRNEVIDFSDITSMQQLTERMDKVKNMEREILTSPDNIFIPNISEDDSAVMRGLKEAIIAKNIDLDKYADRFGDNFPNDKRQFKRNDITLFMFERMCDRLDMKASIIIEDRDPNVPNPIGRKINIDLIGGDDDIES